MMNEEKSQPQLRDVSLWSVEMIQVMKLSHFLDKSAELTDAEIRNQLAALIWIHHPSVSEDDVDAAVENGTWPADVKRFKRNPAMLAALPEVLPMIEKARAILERIEPALAKYAEGQN